MRRSFAYRHAVGVDDLGDRVITADSTRAGDREAERDDRRQKSEQCREFAWTDTTRRPNDRGDRDDGPGHAQGEANEEKRTGATAGNTLQHDASIESVGTTLRTQCLCIDSHAAIAAGGTEAVWVALARCHE